MVTSLRKLRRPKAEAYKTRTVAEASPQPVSLREGAWVTRASGMPCAGCARLLRCVRLHVRVSSQLGTTVGRWDMTPFCPTQNRAEPGAPTPPSPVWTVGVFGLTGHVPPTVPYPPE